MKSIHLLILHRIEFEIKLNQERRVNEDKKHFI